MQNQTFLQTHIQVYYYKCLFDLFKTERIIKLKIDKTAFKLINNTRASSYLKNYVIPVAMGMTNKKNVLNRAAKYKNTIAQTII
jgi:hypothetical protein